MPRQSAEAKERALLCHSPGCTRRWTTTFGPWAACDLHKPSAPAPKPKVPITPPSRPYSEVDGDAD